MSTVNYIPALRFKWLTPLYDFIVGYTMPEKKIKEHLIQAAEISDGQDVLDFGCGTGTLTIMAKEAHSGASITGIDIDIQILNKAIQRAQAKKLDIMLIDYDGSKLPFRDNQFNRIISCLVFHHLDTVTKQKYWPDYSEPFLQEEDSILPTSDVRHHGCNVSCSILFVPSMALNPPEQMPKGCCLY